MDSTTTTSTKPAAEIVMEKKEIIKDKKENMDVS